MIVIVDYGMGNLRSILKKLEMIKAKAIISSNLEDIKNAAKLILPGVGHFGHGMKNMKEYGLIPVLNEKVLKEKTPVLGVCLGMQLFADWSEEGHIEGLGWIQGKIVRFHFNKLAEDHPALPVMEEKNMNRDMKLSIPHVGWNTLDVKQDSILLKGIDKKNRFYFTHSYHWSEVDEKYIVTTTPYGYDFPSMVRKDNMYGTQFHPEKSHIMGLEIYRNFINYA